MLKYKMTVPHVQLKILKMYFSFISIFAIHWRECKLPQLMSVRVFIFHRKIKNPK